MAQLDAERGERIKWLREEQLHLTQEAMADKVGITVRGYQEWEAGGGIKWDNAKKLAKLGGVTPEWIMRGIDQPLETPDLSNGHFKGQSQMDRIEARQEILASELEAIRVELGTALTLLEELTQTLGRRSGSGASESRTRKAK